MHTYMHTYIHTCTQEPLKMEEVIGARLYSGPMFVKYNAVLRAKTQPQSHEVHIYIYIYIYIYVLRAKTQPQSHEVPQLLTD